MWVGCEWEDSDDVSKCMSLIINVLYMWVEWVE